VALPVAALVVVFVTLGVARTGDRSFLLAAVAVAVGAGISATSVGVYGAVLVPGLLLIGIEAREATAISLLLQVLVIPIGAFGHAAVGNVRGAIVRPLLVGGITGSVIGALAASAVSGALISRAIAFIIIVLGVVVLISLRVGRLGATDRSAPSARRVSGIGFVAGAATGISGAGWGPLGIKLLLLAGVDAKIAIGSSLVGRVLIATSALLTYELAGASHISDINPALFLVLFASSIAAMLPGVLIVSQLRSQRATASVASLSIALALPTLLALRF
jgi:uncharacterized membrane protein YfcA